MRVLQNMNGERREVPMTDTLRYAHLASDYKCAAISRLDTGHKNGLRKAP
jgi:hypothetical protein